MPVEPAESTEARKLPFKLRFKQASQQVDAQPLSQHPERRVLAEEDSEEKSAADSNRNGVKASKIAGIAPKKVPRIGPEYQAEIPDLQG